MMVAVVWGGLAFLQGGPLSHSQGAISSSGIALTPQFCHSGQVLFVIFTKGLCRPVEGACLGAK